MSLPASQIPKTLAESSYRRLREQCQQIGPSCPPSWSLGVPIQECHPNPLRPARVSERDCLIRHRRRVLWYLLSLWSLTPPWLLRCRGGKDAERPSTHPNGNTISLSNKLTPTYQVFPRTTLLPMNPNGLSQVTRPREGVISPGHEVYPSCCRWCQNDLSQSPARLNHLLVTPTQNEQNNGSLGPPFATVWSSSRVSWVMFTNYLVRMTLSEPSTTRMAQYLAHTPL